MGLKIGKAISRMFTFSGGGAPAPTTPIPPVIIPQAPSKPAPAPTAPPAAPLSPDLTAARQRARLLSRWAGNGMSSLVLSKNPQRQTIANAGAVVRRTLLGR